MELSNSIPRAVVIEYIHAGTLIHDDYIDLDTVRRCRPAIWTLEGSIRRMILFVIISENTSLNHMIIAVLQR